MNEQRITQLTWSHEGQEVAASVSELLPRCFGAEDEIVIAIYDCGGVFKVCTPSRGAICFDPVVASKTQVLSVNVF